MKQIFKKKGRVVLSLLIAASICPRLHAQDLEKVLPEPVPQLVEAPEQGASDALELLKVNERLDQLEVGAAVGEDVLIAELKGVRIISDESMVQVPMLMASDTIVVEGVPSLTSDLALSVISLYLKRPVSAESLERMQMSLRLTLAQSGRAFSVVYIPPQDITDGFLQIVVVESTIGEIRVEGNEHFSDASYLSRFNQSAGQAVDGRDLQTGVDRINSNSFRSAATRVERGSEPGTTDIVIQAKDRRPIRVFAGYNNTGSQVTKEDRLFAGFNWGNAFGLGHQMTLQWTSDPEARYSRAISGNYTVDLPRSHSATLFGAYSEIESIPAGGLEQAGTSWQTGINYDIPLQPIGRHYTHRVQLGFDFKYSDNNLELALPPFIIPIADNETNIVQFRATYRGTLKDSWGSTSFGLGVTAAPGDLSGKNDDDAFNLSRSLATADYIYGSFDISRSTQLRSFLSGWDWTVRGSLQISNRNLLGSEQFSGGGSSSVRGYEESEVSGDNGVLFSQELILPVLHPSRDLFKSEYRDALRLFVFQDYARTWNVDTLPGEKPFNLLSHGVGLRYQFSQYATLNVSHGWQARDSGSSDTGDDSRTHISFQISY